MDYAAWPKVENFQNSRKQCLLARGGGQGVIKFSVDYRAALLTRMVWVESFERLRPDGKLLREGNEHKKV